MSTCFKLKCDSMSCSISTYYDVIVCQHILKGNSMFTHCSAIVSPSIIQCVNDIHKLKNYWILLTSNRSATRSMRRTLTETCLGRTFPWTTVIAITLTSGEQRAKNSAWASSIPASQSIKMDLDILF